MTLIGSTDVQVCNSQLLCFFNRLGTNAWGWAVCVCVCSVHVCVWVCEGWEVGNDERKKGK